VRTRCDPTTEGRARYSIVEAQGGPCRIVSRMKHDCAYSCGHPLSQANPPKLTEHPFPVKKRRRPHLRITFHKPTFFAPDSKQPTNSPMSSFHTTTNSTSGSCGPYQMAETTVNEQSVAAVTSNWGAAGPIVVSTGSPLEHETLLTFSQSQNLD
jgi:hypothetical protein